MKILKTMPAADSFYMPAEFDRHSGCILIWPHRRDSWQNGGYAARRAFVRLCTLISDSEKVTVCARAQDYDEARRELPDNVRIVEMSSDDSWARDVAPTFVTNGKELRGIDWGFNAWGGLYNGLYFPWDQDNKLARKLCDIMDVDCYDLRHFILEGGSIHTDGEGTVITTEECLLSPGRNPELSRIQIEKMLSDTIGAKKVIWLPRGIYNDETDGHIDNICAFTSPTNVVLAWTDDENDPQYEISKECLDVLCASTDAKGRSITVHKLLQPSPVYVTEEDCRGLDCMDGEPTRVPGDRLAASYVNFYISNSTVIVPQFGDKNDAAAIETLSALFPTRKVVGLIAEDALLSRDILIGGGNIHCITQQIPDIIK